MTKDELDVLFPKYEIDDAKIDEMLSYPVHDQRLCSHCAFPPRLHIGWRHTLAMVIIRILMWCAIAFVCYQLGMFLVRR